MTASAAAYLVIRVFMASAEQQEVIPLTSMEQCVQILDSAKVGDNMLVMCLPEPPDWWKGFENDERRGHPKEAPEHPEGSDGSPDSHRRDTTRSYRDHAAETEGLRRWLEGTSTTSGD